MHFIREPRLLAVLPFLVGGCLLTGCATVKRMAVNQVGNALAGGGTTFASDDDPELIRQAVPFSLKLMESLLAESPGHRALLLGTCRGFTQYAYAFVQQDADELEANDLVAARELRARARRLYLRARDYGLRGLDTAHAGFGRELKEDPKSTVARARRADVPLLYWTAAAWGSAISLSKDNPELVADVPIVEALIDRALELDERFEDGAIHSFLITYEMARAGGTGDPADRAGKHFERAVELSQGQLASPFVAYAEQVAVSRQDRAGFIALLERALAVDPDRHVGWRLENLVMQRRARWLLGGIDELFLPEE